MSNFNYLDLRKRLIEIDNNRCSYCHTTVLNSGQQMTIDHIIPESQGGLTEINNLCLCCRRCNEHKSNKISAHDPLSGEFVPLFNPRQQIWGEHFKWDDTGTFIIGLTAIGRATIVCLNMNDKVIVSARSRWVSVGWHPPIF